MINPQVYMYAGAFQSWYKRHKGRRQQNNLFLLHTKQKGGIK